MKPKRKKSAPTWKKTSIRKPRQKRNPWSNWYVVVLRLGEVTLERARLAELRELRNTGKTLLKLKEKDVPRIQNDLRKADRQKLKRIEKNLHIPAPTCYNPVAGENTLKCEEHS